MDIISANLEFWIIIVLKLTLVYKVLEILEFAAGVVRGFWDGYYRAQRATAGIKSDFEEIG